MGSTMSTQCFAGICLSFLYFGLTAVVAQDLRAFGREIGIFAAGDEGDNCSKSKACKIGCCGPLNSDGKGVCGLGPDYCGDDCTSTCDRKSECDPGWGLEYSNMSTCSLNVCCSEFGFCGTTSEFCGGATVVSPECPEGKSATEKVIGYYEGWNLAERTCGTMEPEEIPLGRYTHINFAFSLIHPETFRLDPMDPETASLYSRVSKLKRRQPSLQVWIAIGGWEMNDPGPYRTAFSDLAKSTSAQDSFFESLVTILQKHDFDGVDLDWEYPVADDRGGIKEDFGNFVILLQRLRERLNATGRKYGLTLTLPASYWYLRGFDIVRLEPYLDWFNIMTYDIHGLWDQNVTAIGSYAYAHTNLTEIQDGLELLWRNNINPARVVMGLGFYGRSFTMADPNCLAAGCEFAGPGRAGNCTDTEGVLSAAEINQIIKDGGTITFDEAAAVKLVTWDDDQWVSWDDAETLKLKLDYANRRCLGGTMVWAIDLDDGTLIDALGSNLGRDKEDIFPEPPHTLPDLGTSSDDRSDHDEL